MLSSMTGFGEARDEREGWSVTVELRSVNSRYFKFNFRASEGFAGLEPKVESLLRDRIRRGTVYAQVRLERLSGAESYRINGEVLRRYRDDVASLLTEWPQERRPSWDALLLLPGVVDEVQSRQASLDEVWELLQGPLVEAVDGLNAMREQEGAALGRDLCELADAIDARLAAISQRAPSVVEDYRARIIDRVNQSLADLNVKIEAADLVREVALFCDRSDISEEIVRMRSHLEQFRETLDIPESSGRKLEFIVQEMGRETNTIGSKANDTEIATHVVEIKTALERIREQVQNVE